MTAMTDDELRSAFEDATLPGECLRHREHVRLAWIYLRGGSLPAAIERFVTALRRYAEAQGKPDRYHATITWAYLLLVHERMQQPGAAATWEGFAGQNPDLLCWAPSILDRYYRPETLRSDQARREFVLPDFWPK